MWWTKRYVNRRDWIFENLGTLKLSPEQVVVVCMIDYMNQYHMPIDLKELASRCFMDLETVDMVIHTLTLQNALEIKPGKERIEFSLEPLFKNGILYEYVDQTIFEIFEGEFGRPLSQNELERLNQWLSQYTQNEIINGLRTAIIYQKLNFAYINTILANNRKESKA